MQEPTKRVPSSELEYPGDGLYYLGNEPFSGFALFIAKDGREKGYAEYLNGLCWGETRETYPEGTPAVEATFFKGVKHGRAREWHRNGHLAEHGEYEYGITLWEKTWSENGAIERDYRLEEGDEAYQRLLEYRALYKKYAPVP